MAKLKVWGIATFLPGVKGQVRAIVAASSRKLAAKALQCSDHFMAGYAGESGNQQELSLALANPGKVFCVCSHCRGTGYVKYDASPDDRKGE